MYDGDRLVSSTPEPEWDDESRAWIEAADIVERLTGRNGEWLPDATADPTDYDGRVVRYKASEEKVNLSEKARLDKLDEIKKSKGEKANMNGVFVTVEERVFESTT